jgi:hypothetical protein
VGTNLYKGRYGVIRNGRIGTIGRGNDPKSILKPCAHDRAGDSVVRMRKGALMTNGAAGAAAGGAAAAAIAQAIKASGAIVRVESRDFATILTKTNEPLVVCAVGGFFSTNYQYLTSYKGLIFFTKTDTPLQLPSGCETVQSKKIWIPG